MLIKTLSYAVLFMFMISSPRVVGLKLRLISSCFLVQDPLCNLSNHMWESLLYYPFNVILLYVFLFSYLSKNVFLFSTHWIITCITKLV